MFAAPKLTDAGKALYYENMGGAGITFTTIQMGKGTLSGRSNQLVGKSAAEAGYWTLLRVDGANAMSEDDVTMFKDLGVEIWAELKEDGTGVLALDNPVNVTWADCGVSARHRLRHHRRRRLKALLQAGGRLPAHSDGQR